MKYSKSILRWFVCFLVILCFGMGVGYGLSLFNNKEATSDRIETTSDTESIKTTNDLEPSLLDLVAPSPESVDIVKIEDIIFQLVNELRTELDVGTLEKNETLRLAATVRAIETEDSFSHTRPDGTQPFTVLEEDDTFYPYSMAGENLAMATYFRGDQHMAHLIFEGWVESEEHYETMINPDFEEIGIGVHYDGEILYATQFFGKPR